MSIRFSSIQIHNQGVNQLLDLQRNVSNTQQKIATGKRVLTPGDDPIAATRILQLTQELELNSLFNNNANDLQNRLEREDIALSNISDLLQRAQELVIQAGDGAINAEQRGFIAIEMDGIIESMAQAMNGKDGSGNFMFAGLQANEPPYSRGGDGHYQYTGDEGSRTIQLGTNSFVRANDSGKSLFEDVESNAISIKAQANPRNRADPPATIGSTAVLNQDLLNSFYPEDVVIEFRPLDEVQPSALTFNVKQVSDGRIIYKNQPYQSGQMIEFSGAGVRITGNPSPGDSFMVSSTNKRGLISTLEDFSAELKSLTDSPDDRGRLSNKIDLTLEGLDKSQTRLLEGQSDVGTRLNLVDNVRSSNADIRLATQATLSELQDLDFAEAISQLTQETFILEAAQASFVRVSRLSLFNFL